MLKKRLGEVMRVLAEKLLVDGRIAECSRVFSMAEFYREALMSGKRDLLRLKVLRTYRVYSERVRKAFLLISTEGVNDPSKAFKLTYATFSKVLKDAKIMPLLPTAASAGIIFQKCNSVDFEQTPSSSAKKRGMKAPEPEEEDRTLELDEFVEALLRLAAECYPDEGDAADRLRAIIEDNFLPYLPRLELRTADEEPDEEEAALVDALISGHAPKLKKLFKHYAGEGAGPGEDADSVSCDEFLQMAKECRLASLGLSYTKCLDTFIDSNEEEVNEFIKGDLTEELADAMQMDYDEFLVAMRSLVIRLPVPARAKKTRVYTDFFTSMFRECPHYHLNLSEIE